MADQTDTGRGSPDSQKSQKSRASRTSITPPRDDHPTLEPDDADLTDSDSAVDAASIAGSATTSLASSIARYRMENGRTYHSYKDGSYYLPNDESEIERLDLQHHLCYLTFNDRLFVSPIGDRPLKRVLDAGCGTGVWAMDMADEHPEAEVIGVDLSPIQPSIVPPNASFIVDDLEAEWTYEKPFDLIYLRFLVGSISEWDKLFKQAFKHLSPGGWIEAADAVFPIVCDDGSVTKDSAVYKWSSLMIEATSKVHPGRRMDKSLELKDMMIEQGYTNVTENWFRWPINSWPKDPKFKEIGTWVTENALSGLAGMTLALFTRVLNWSREEVEIFLVDVRREMRDRNLHGYFRILAVCGQKPTESTKESS